MMKRRFLTILPILAILAAAVVLIVLWPWRTPESNKELENSTAKPSGRTSTSDNQKNFPVIDLQPTINAWAARQSASGGGTASVWAYDLDNDKAAGSINPERQYFTASIYKLYVAYTGYLKIADGTYKMDEPYLSGYTRGQCLDAMIRESYSPCGEKMWNELGKENITRKMRSYGLSNTSLTGLYTSARDSGIILQRLFENNDLTPKYSRLYLDSLKTQPAKYRRGLPSGFTKSTVHNKVGWNGQVEWHDAAIVTLPDKHSYVITVFTENVGPAQIAALGRAIEQRLFK